MVPLDPRLADAGAQVIRLPLQQCYFACEALTTLEKFFKPVGVAGGIIALVPLRGHRLQAPLHVSTSFDLHRQHRLPHAGPHQGNPSASLRRNPDSRPSGASRTESPARAGGPALSAGGVMEAGDRLLSC
jgi:hypothetical protein